MTPPRRWGLRARLTATAAAVAVVGLIVGSILMLTLLQRAILGSLDDSARSDAADVAALVDTGRLSDPLPTFGATVAQVIGEDGTVRASSPGGDRLTPIVSNEELDEIRDGAAVEIPGSRLGEPDPFHVVGVEAGPASDPQTVLVAVSLAEQRSSGALIRTGAAVGVPALVAVIAVAAWYGVGRALRPVEVLRRDASVISGTVSGRRLAVPPVQDEIARLAETLNAMLARIESASRSQRVFVADAAHELRSPLAALRAELEVWQAHPDQVDAAETIHEALTEAERMQRLVADLLALARLDDADADGHSARRQEVALNDVVTSVVSQYAGSGQHREALGTNGSVSIAVEHIAPVDAADQDVIRVEADPEALARAVANLIDNGVRHARSRVTVTVSEGATDWALVSVADDGDGVAEPDRERIFDRFARLDEARSRDDGGTGLGLAIVKATVEAHQGHVTVVDGAPGARFVISLPRSD